MREVCRGLNLYIFIRDEFFTYAETLHKEANEVYDSKMCLRGISIHALG